ncbi:hypothetical protein GTP46_11495 [Duganella sp. FT135W]|uniref:Uncharacterized protein n=1 Tax=Duganella flavida TaxID=2692175 RepID=A0A6L8K7V6_9BURK|nr:hypothetical protein [Duganella flavida]MYM23270.1 hypothetical protein [Duganella flavida]
MSFIAPTPCNIDTVNAALVAAGYDDVDIFYDPYNSNNVSVSYRNDEHSPSIYQKQTTRYSTAKQWAEDLEAGHFRLKRETE